MNLPEGSISALGMAPTSRYDQSPEEMLAYVLQCLEPSELAYILAGAGESVANQSPEEMLAYVLQCLKPSKLAYILTEAEESVAIALLSFLNEEQQTKLIKEYRRTVITVVIKSCDLEGAILSVGNAIRDQVVDELLRMGYKSVVEEVRSREIEITMRS
ncbi:hypothetical protein GP486_002244 [Trichoglossum hirsutum]|uniref:Uncharacterized protein n=1 Tax=Trichoglossum hirsutum TaxID=265104 RepID=A0A9P8LFK4_9PEZI|nr:hypothetical protein GP486_002244 [Trichoglossum hirsutum]